MMIKFIWLSVVGALLLFVTASFDFYSMRFDTSSSVADEDKPPAIGNSPSDSKAHQISLIPLGYIAAVILQIPAALSVLGAI